MDDVTRAMSKGGGGACGYLCKISGKSTPLPPLTKAFPYAYGWSRIKGLGPKSEVGGQDISLNYQDPQRHSRRVQLVMDRKSYIYRPNMRFHLEPLSLTLSDLEIQAVQGFSGREGWILYLLALYLLALHPCVASGVCVSRSCEGYYNGDHRGGNLDIFKYRFMYKLRKNKICYRKKKRKRYVLLQRLISTE